MLHRPLIQVAPEAVDRFDQTYRDFELRYVDSPVWILEERGGIISISTVVVEALWALGFSQFVIYRDVYRAGVLTGGWVDFRGTEGLARAARLLDWIVHKLMHYSERGFLASDFADVPAIARKLRQPEMPVLTYIRERLSPAALEALANYAGPGTDPVPLQMALVTDFNGIMRGPSIYDAVRFGGEVLRLEAQQMINVRLEGQALERFNRILLEDVFAAELSKVENDAVADWPAELPRPIVGGANPREPRDEDVADEFCLGGCGCLLHHEFAHIQLEHPGGVGIEGEQDADNTSWEWILPNGFDVDSPAGQKRLLILAHSYVLLVALDVHRGRFGGRTHPRSIDRLANVLARVDTSEGHVGYAYAFSALHLHLCGAQAGPGPVQQNGRRYESALDAFNRTVDHLSRTP